MLKLLKASYDRELSAEENDLLRKALENDAELRKEAISLQKLRDLMQQDDVTFSPFFTEKVMNRLDMQEDNGYIFAFSRIALPFLAAAIILLLITFWGHSISFDSIMGVEKLQPEYLTDFLLYNY